MGQVGLDGAPTDQQALADLRVRHALRDQLDNLELGGGKARPPAGGALALATGAGSVGHRLLNGQRSAFRPGGAKGLVTEDLAQPEDPALVGFLYLGVVVPGRWFLRHRDNRQAKAFVADATGAAAGALSGAVVVLTRQAIVDGPTAAIAVTSLALLWRFKIPEPAVVAAAGALGLLIY